MICARPLLACLLICCCLHLPTALAAKTLVYCAEGSPESLTRLFAAGQNTADVGSQVADTLLDFKPGTTSLQGGLAEAWTVSPDGLVYTFKLRHGVKFHSNAGFTPSRDFNADDVLFTWNRQADPQHPYHAIAGALAYVQFTNLRMAENVEKVEKLDDYTLRFRLKHPESPFLTRLAFDLMGIQSAEYAQKLLTLKQPERLDREPIGTGPFQFASYQKDAVIRFKAFPQHWRGKPKVDALVFAITPDAAVQFAKLKAGECHISTALKPADITLAAKDAALRLISQPGANVGYLALNTTKKPLDDKRVRQALNLAIDRAAILSTLFQGRATLARGILPPFYWAADPALAPFAYDPARARQLLAQAGYPQGFALQLWYLPVVRPHNPDGKRMAEMMQADLAKIGVTATLATFEWGEYLKRIRNGEHQAAMFGWLSGNGEPDNYFEPLLSCAAVQSGGNLARWCQPEFESVLQQARRSADQAERTKLYARAQAIVHEELPLLPIAHGNRFAVTRKEVTGFTLEPSYLLDFRSTDLAR